MLVSSKLKCYGLLEIHSKIVVYYLANRNKRFNDCTCMLYFDSKYFCNFNFYMDLESEIIFSTILIIM